MSCRIKLLSLANGEKTEFSDQYVVVYDPHFMPPNGVYDGGKLVVTKDPTLAKEFQNVEELVRYWRQSHGTREDGKPNRPLTAYSIEIV